MKKILILLLAVILVLSFTALVACKNNNEKPTIPPTETPTTETPTGNGDGNTTESDIEAAAEYVRQLYKDVTNTSMDYTLVSKVKVGGVTYSIAWTVSVDTITVTDNGDGTVTVDVPDKSDVDIAYVLTATVSDADGNSVVKEFNRLVPKFAVNTWAEYYDAEAGDSLIVEGVVTGIVSKSLNGSSNNCIFLQDTKTNGGYYVYGMADDPATLGIEIGMTVRVSGTKDIYSGTHELKPTGVEIISETKTPATPIDITAAYTNAENLKDKALVALQGALVTIKGVEITDQNESSGYYNFILAGKASYIRISGSTCAITKAEQTTFKNTHTAKRGYLADATGIVSVYNGAIYLVPVTVDAFNNFQMVERTDAEKVEYEAGNLKVDSAIHMNTTLTLPTAGVTYSDVKIAWASNNACAVVDGGKVAITLQDEAQTVKLTATVTLGTESKTVEFTVAVDAKPTTIPSIVDTPVAGTAYKFMLTQGNLGQNLFINGEMAATYYFGTTTDYNEAIDVYVEVVDGGYKLYTMVGNDKTYISVVLSDDGAHVNVVYSTVTASVYTWNTEHKTFTIDITGSASKDGTYFFGTYDTKTTFSASKIDKISTNFVAHLVVMVDAADCNHTYAGACDATCDLCGETREDVSAHTYDNACDDKCNVCNAERSVPDHVDANTDGACDECNATMPGQVIDTIAKALGAADGTEVTLTATVVSIGTVWSDQYNNISVTVKDANGDELYLYRLGTKVEVGDIITFTGVMATYNDNRQVGQGATATIIGKDNNYVYVEMSIADAIAAPDNKNVIVSGTVVSIDTAWDSGYKNMSVTISDGNGKTLYIYRLATKVNVGDQITVKGAMATHDEVRQIVGGTATITAAHTCTEYVEGVCPVCGAKEPTGDNPPAGDGTISISDALAAADETSVKVRGTVISTDAWSDQYNNISVTIADDNGNKLYVFRLGTKVAVGDIIVVDGTMATYNGARQIAQGATATIEGKHTCSNYKDATCSAPKTCVVCGATVGEALEHTYDNGVCTGCGLPVGATTAELDFSSTSNRTVFTSSQQVWSANGITLTNNQGSSTSPVADYSNPARFYKSSDIKIEAEGTITKIVFEANNASYADALAGAIGSNATVSGTTVTVEFATAVESFEVTLTVGQVRMNSLTVTYNS